MLGDKSAAPTGPAAGDVIGPAGALIRPHRPWGHPDTAIRMQYPGGFVARVWRFVA